MTDNRKDISMYFCVKYILDYLLDHPVIRLVYLSLDALSLHKLSLHMKTLSFVRYLKQGASSRF